MGHFLQITFSNKKRIKENSFWRFFLGGGMFCFLHLISWFFLRCILPRNADSDFAAPKTAENR